MKKFTQCSSCKAFTYNLATLSEYMTAVVVISISSLTVDVGLGCIVNQVILPFEDESFAPALPPYVCPVGIQPSGPLCVRLYNQHGN